MQQMAIMHKLHISLVVKSFFAVFGSYYFLPVLNVYIVINIELDIGIVVKKHSRFHSLCGDLK